MTFVKVEEEFPISPFPLPPTGKGGTNLIHPSFIHSTALFFNEFIIYLFVYLFLAVLVLRCCVQAFSSCSERGLLIAVASLVAEHRL